MKEIVRTTTLCLLLTFLSLLQEARSGEAELRGVWVAWAGSSVPAKERIAAIMDNVAAGGMNAVYVDVWRYGFPYFRSQVFRKLTGLYTDPALPEGRDVLAEMIAEGHRVGLHVHAWFEYGFVACQGSNDHLYRQRPDWFAKRRNGSILFNGEYQYKWLSHCNREAQQFLVSLCLEVARNYDVDGIQLDRIRYPELDCGYDEATVALYAAEHNGSPPPQNPADPQWMRWRANKLTSFVALLYDSLKQARPDLPVSSTPIVYPYGYDNFCQDWRPWFNEHHLDAISPQVYRATDAIYASELDLQLSHVLDRSYFYPGITSVFEQYLLPTEQLVSMIRITRGKGLRGHVVWFYDTLADDLPALAATVYQEPAGVPGMPTDWRQPSIIVNEDDSTVTRTGTWTNYTGIAGFRGGCLYTSASPEASIEYWATISHPGWYEVYAFIPYHWNAAREARYQVRYSQGVDTVVVNQGLASNARWYKLGDYHLAAGSSPVVRLTNESVGTRYLFADAVMLCNSNRAARLEAGARRSKGTQTSGTRFTLSSYPNPFRESTAIALQGGAPEGTLLCIVDVQGRCVARVQVKGGEGGSRTVRFHAGDLPSGIYFCLPGEPGKEAVVHKMVLLR
ncbi:MAG: family 10 glycosylhydrolase [candidate division KSB1 bacterium]|nr:family 10 glycosylhydrolase [candidate division KSB1 bacterium]MDZ7293854.1 family 10 glycosylhydrolase [candidate division KSB1 bacterium]